MTFFLKLQLHLNIPVEYHFFASNHGHSVCDAAASQAKSAINVFQRDVDIVKTPQQIVNVISTIQLHQAKVANGLNVTIPPFQTFNGITSFHKYKFTNTHVQAFELSESNILKKSYLAELRFNFLA